MPGKFANEADEFVYGLSLDGCEAEAGDVQYGDGWYGLLLFGADEAAEIQTRAGLERRPVGAIVNEDSQGFWVTASYYDDHDALMGAWEEIEDAQPREEGPGADLVFDPD